MVKSGIVAIVGRANVGKSTLLNYLVGEKVAIVSPVPQTTRNQIRAILNESRGQVVFLDTPGFHVTKHALDRAMISAINTSLSGVDIVLHLVDATEHVGEEEGMVIERLSTLKVPIILGLNKIDRDTRCIEEYLAAWEKKSGKKLSEITDKIMPVPFSALTGVNVSCLLDEIFARLPEGEALYPDNILTDFPRQLMIQDVVREKLLGYLKEELPFSVAVHAQEIIDRSAALTYVKAIILVERESQRSIVIGKKGEALKKAGEAARHELAELYGKKFYLDLWVKVDDNWKQDTELLKQMGYFL